MSNQLLNPIIQNHPHDTLSYCSNCLNYLQESLSTLEFSETSEEAQQGIFWIIACINQAVDFEANRALYSGENKYLSRSATMFEKDVFKSVCRQINEERVAGVSERLPGNDG